MYINPRSWVAYILVADFSFLLILIASKLINIKTELHALEIMIAKRDLNLMDEINHRRTRI